MLPRKTLAAAGVCAAAVCTAAFLAVSGVQAASATTGSKPPPDISAAAGKLVNVGTGKELWGRQPALQLPIASITKVMTALVVARTNDLRKRIRITQADVDYVQYYGLSNAGLHAGDILTGRQLLYAMLLPSGADAARALAESYGPGIPAFVRKMNRLASMLHLRSTHFTNFDGLDSTDVSTAADLIKLGEAAMRQPAIRAVVASKWHRVKAWPHRHPYFWRNSNLLLKRYPGVIGIKTGWTPVAGECLLFEAVHRKKVLIGVVLDSAPTNSGVTFVGAAKLLNWAFGLNVPIPPPTPALVKPGLSVGG